VINGNDGAQAALGPLRSKGGRLVAIVGKQAGGLSLHPAPILIVEEGGEGEPDTGRPHELRVVSTMKMSTLKKEVRGHVSNGFRPIGAGYMAVVMERDPDVTAPLIEVDLVDTVPPCGLKAINDLAAQGFRVIPKASSLPVADAGIVIVSHLVFLLQRVPGAAEKCEYSFIDASDKAAAQLMRSANAEGFVPVGLIGGLLIAERTARAEVR
jgi:hypothetical protein